MTVTIKKTDTTEEINRKSSSVCSKSTKPDAKDFKRLLLNGPIMSDKQFEAYKTNRKRFGS
jgi:hypothetical protein